MTHTRLEIKGIIYVILSGLFYGLVGYFGMQALEHTPSIANMLFWRFIIASLFIALFMLPQLKKMKIDWPAMTMIFTASAIFYGSSTFAFFTASQQMGTGVAMVIFFTYPAIVILCNRFIYNHQISPRYYLSVLFILIGLLLLIELKLNFNYLSLLLGLISACGYAFYIMASKKYNHLHPLLAALMVCLGCSFFCLIFALSHNGFLIPAAPLFWFNSVGLGIISTAVPILLLLKGLQYIA
ncbi:MAG TPA: DMT family transporter, partial [Gammaproteobacteria bacterium]|nr:DMT family transporter [Gammaproteobacteria bacterium]